MGPGRDASLDVPLLLAPGAIVELLVVDAAGPATLSGLRVEVNGLPLVTAGVPHDHGTIVRGVVPASYASARGFTRLSLRTPASPEGTGLSLRWARLTAGPQNVGPNRAAMS
jgi:hypothetical protein